jgi:gamma-glutamyl:cysteine ligase YbdK (ATP-grasp superfamily)
MIVDRESLAVRPVADRLLRALAEAGLSPRVGWSNELVRHVVEIKNVHPAPDLASLPACFHEQIVAANAMLSAEHAQLMPTAAHPWMDPQRETTLWDDDIYRTYDRIYGCNAHGWANLQSMHVNLPFANDTEFARLHAAIRLVLPLLPAIAASSPIVDGAPSGLLDYRLDAYRRICAITPSVPGRVIPETVETRAEYDAKILRPMYAEIAPHDPERVLAYEWLNSRGAIARFDRCAIEIRVIDVQECPHVDLAIAAATAAVVKSLYDERYAPLDEQQAIGIDVLHGALVASIRDGDGAIVDDVEYLHALGMPMSRCIARDIWASLLRDVDDEHAWWRPTIDAILREGPLARRILRAVGSDPDRERIAAVYRSLCQCLEDGRMFRG